MFRFTESRDSRQQTIDPPSFVYRYAATGSNDQAYIVAVAISSTPAIVWTTAGLLYRQDVRLDWRGYQACRVEVPYASRKNEIGSYSLSFDTTGASTHITFSKESIAKHPEDTARDFKQLIGVNDGNVEGTDITIPALKITAHFKHPAAVITLPRIKQLARLTGKTNSAPFLTFADNEVLFMGAVGNEGTDVETDVAYHFAMSENADDLSIGDIADIAKKGWEVVWVRWQEKVDTDELVKQPKAVYVERVYDSANFANELGFGA